MNPSSPRYGPTFNLTKENNMSNLKQQSALLIEGLKTVSVMFWQDRYKDANGKSNWGGKHYAYKTLQDYKEGDLLAVNVSGEYKIVKVIEMDVFPKLDKATQWIISKVDTSNHEKILEVEDTLVTELEIIQQKAFRDSALFALAEQSNLSKDDIFKLTNATSKMIAPLIEKQ